MFQLAAGFGVSDVLEGIEKLFNDVLNQTQTAIASIQDQSDGILTNFLDEAQSKIDDLVPTLESKIYSQFSEVVNAAPKIEACVEAEQQNISAIVDSACKYASCKIWRIHDDEEVDYVFLVCDAV